jgi:sigma-B regulation protein RsbQ
MPEGVGSMEMSTDILARNNVTLFGGGTQPMVFAHGFGCDQQMWRFLTPAFEDDYRIVLFDYVGHGGSDRTAYDPDRYGTLDGFAQDILDVVEALDLRQAILVGHSVSSIVGVLAINRSPERFERLVMIGPSPRYINDPPEYQGGFERADIEGLLDMMDKNYIGWAGALAPMIMGNPDRPDLGDELNTSFCSTDPVVARQFAHATFLGDNRADLQQLPVPSLVLQCSEDAIAPPRVGEYVARITPGSTFRQLRATGHCPHLSHPEETIAAIREYLAAPVAT